ncbi:MAG: VTT domain-containing protein [Rhodocyclaceae bacterium]|nr:VTT domain-containing protein [Rhodocyclaceae bacterium]
MRKYRQFIAVLVFVGLLLFFVEYFDLRHDFSLEFMQEQIMANKLSGLLIFILLFSVGNLIHLPGWLFLAAAVITLGKTWGGLATYTAATTSCVVTFFSIKWIGGDALRQFDNKLAMRIFRHLDDRPIRSIALLRIVFQTMPTLNYALALSRIKFSNYLIGTLIGLPVPITLYCFFFDFLANAFLPGGAS